ncbi:hypothetical protein Psi02_33010 [Planotetraspora silvatica]|uniref:Uncharacterized protein n=1 Tax=Planotetraspora silvatica TaxID=234614 RepID=A0A8J3UKX9_9ACTN|nr:hypothetical protein [Planotetraspora silvatica]GII46877.1 hypothetical protein Psi02_33010 [Planotetraspora silvatica]
MQRTVSDPSQAVRSPTALLSLQRTSGNLSVAHLVVQRNTYTSDKVKTLLTETAADDVPGAITSDHGAWLGQASDDERIALLNACTGGSSKQAEQAIDLIWHRTQNWRALAAANPGVWQRSVKALPSDGSFFRNLEDAFLEDTEQVARGYLTMNEQYCDSSLTSMAYDRNGKPIIGPPTAEQAKARENPVDQQAAKDLVVLQEKLSEARKIELGTRPVVTGSAESPSTEWVPVYFNPDAAPADYSKSPSAPPYEELKKAYDFGVEAIGDLLSLHPRLYILVRDKIEDTSKTARVSSDTSAGRQDTLTLIATELAATIASIGTTRPMLGKVVAKELTPIHRQLRQGTATSPARPGRNWSNDPVWKPVADMYAERSGDPPWWVKLGLTALEMGVYVIAGLATGGIGFAAAMAIKGAGEAALAAGKAGILTAASRASVSDDTKLADSRKAEEAQSEVKMALAFAALDAVMIGVEVRSLLIAGKVATAEGAQAIKAIEMSGEVLTMERKLLGRVPLAEAEETTALARTKADEVRKLAGEARAAAAKSGGKDAQLEARARMAEAAAERADKAANRVKDLKDKIAISEQAKSAVPKEELGEAFSIGLEGGGELIVTKTGKLFVCQSPCMALTERYAAVISRNRELTQRAVAVRMAEQDAEKLLPGMKAPSAKAVQARLGALAQTFQRDCVLFQRAEEIAGWLHTAESTYPGLKGANLDAAAVVRVLKKGPGVEAAKGQLLEEIAAVQVKSMLATSEGRAKLAGQFAGEALEFIPGHRLRDAQGRQLTDGIIGFWEGPKFRIVTVIESKAGRWSAEGLRYGKQDLQAILTARSRVIRKAFAQNPDAVPNIRALSLDDFIQLYDPEIKAALRRVESEDDWKREALEEVKKRAAAEVRAAGNAREAARIQGMGLKEFSAKFPEKAALADDLVPLPEAGQFALDLERAEQIGGQILDAGNLPQIAEDGKLGKGWAGAQVPSGTWKPTEFVGNRGSVRMQGFVPADANAGQIAANMQSTQGLQGDVAKSGLSTTEFHDIADEIVKRGKNQSK